VWRRLFLAWPDLYEPVVLRWLEMFPSLTVFFFLAIAWRLVLILDRPLNDILAELPIDEEVKNHVTIEPDLAGGRTDYDPWANRRGYSHLRSPHKQGRRYRVWLPEVLKAYEVYHTQSDPDHFKDEFGRTLPAPIDLRFATDHRLPDYAITHRKAVLEKAVDSEMPLVVTNLEEVSVTYDRLTTEGKRGNARLMFDFFSGGFTDIQ